MAGEEEFRVFEATAKDWSTLLDRGIVEDIEFRVGEGHRVMVATKGREVLGFCDFILRAPKYATISYIFGNLRSGSAHEFKRLFGVSPSQGILEALVRKGVERFGFDRLFLDGRKFFNRFERAGLIEIKKGKEVNVEVDVTPKGIAAANSRRVVPEARISRPMEPAPKRVTEKRRPRRPM